MCWDTFGVVLIHYFFLNFHLWSSQRKEPDGISLDLLPWGLFWHLFGVRVCSVCKLIMVERNWWDTNGNIDPECPVHVGSPTPCLIILVTINPMNIMVPKVSWWMNVQNVWAHPPLDSSFWPDLGSRKGPETDRNSLPSSRSVFPMDLLCLRWSIWAAAMLFPTVQEPCGPRRIVFTELC